MNDAHYGHIVNTHYDYINLFTKMKDKNPQRFKEFKYSNASIYHYIDRLQTEQNLYD